MNSFLKVGSLSLISATAMCASARAATLSSVEDFYSFYGSDFSAEAQTFIEDIYTYVTPYLGADGLAQAVADGFVPMTPEAKFHGTHWVQTGLVHNFVAEPTRPAGLNFDENNQLVAVFWAENKFEGVSSQS